jgi:4-phospho-D-threonate 3-dehydrogenase / 4-phospho-D-erythronate 3-dehydrogenase
VIPRPSNLPRIALTMGDPAGIGPEIVRKAIEDPRVLGVCTPVPYGPATSFTPCVLSA